MTDSTIFEFDDANRLGAVVSVDTSRVLISVDNAELLPRASVGSLVAIQGSTSLDFLIGVVERVTRQLREALQEPDPLDPTLLGLTTVQDDALTVTLVGTFRSRDGTARNLFKRGADSFPQIDRVVYLLEAGNLQRFMSLLGVDLDAEQRLELGNFAIDRTAAAIANGDRFFQRHAAILGSTGSGKSYAVSLLLQRASARKYANLIVFDVHGEYASLAHPPAPDGETPPPAIASYFKIAGPGDLESPDAHILFLPYWLLNRDEMLSMILDRSDQNAPNQTSRFTTHVRALKDERLVLEQNEQTRKTFTVDSPIPYDLSALIGRLGEDDVATKPGKNTEIKGDWNGKLTRFISRLQAKTEDRRYGFMFAPPPVSLLYNWLAEQIVRLLDSSDSNQGIKVVDFSEVPSDVLPIVTGVLARLLYDVQLWSDPKTRRPFVIVCDEAHLYLPVRDDSSAVEKQALYVFERIAKEGRKYGVSLVVVSQRPSDVSRTILSQCNNFLVLRLTNDQDQSVVRRLMPDSLAGVLDGLPLLDVGEALLLGDAILLPARIKLALPKISPLSQTRNVWTEWGEAAPDSNAIATAVETLRRQSRSTA